MPLAQKILLNVPALLLAVIIVGSLIFFSTIGLYLIWRFVPHHKRKLHNDIAGPIFEILGVTYAVLMAFVVVVVWESYDRAKFDVEREANCLSDIYRDAECFSEEFKGEVKILVNEYSDAVINEEWKTLARGEGSPHATEVLKKMFILYGNYSPRTNTEEAFFEESARNLNELSNFRRERIIASKSGVHPVLWLVLIIGGIVTVAFTFFFGSENLGAHILMASLLATVISLIFFTILVFDVPFTGDIGITPEPFKTILIY